MQFFIKVLFTNWRQRRSDHRWAIHAKKPPRIFAAEMDQEFVVRSDPAPRLQRFRDRLAAPDGNRRAIRQEPLQRLKTTTVIATRNFL